MCGGGGGGNDDAINAQIAQKEAETEQMRQALMEKKMAIEKASNNPSWG